MKALLQRVTAASVRVGDEEVGSIKGGLCAFVGVAAGDTEEDMDYLVNKTINLRIFADEAGKFNRSLLDTKGELLAVSQFTLLADSRHGRRPSFTDAAPPAEASRLFDLFITRAKEAGVRVATGRFQEYMQVEIHNDGPVTVMVDSKQR